MNTKFIIDDATRLAVANLYTQSVYVRRHYDYILTVLDTDSRRWIKVTCRRMGEFLEDNNLSVGDLAFFTQTAPLFAAVRAELDAGPPYLTALALTVGGEVLSRSTDPSDDVTPGTHYASLGDYQIPAHIKTLARDELVEITRLVTFIDIVVPASSTSPEQELLVFKYYQNCFDIGSNWNSIHIGAMLSTHPHIAPVRHVIVDETDRSRVVGFTTPFFPGGTLLDTGGSRVFKLKYAKQLFQTVDDLHFKYGVSHSDIHEGNVVIDPATDNLVLIDFGCSGKFGTPEYPRHLQAAVSPEAPPKPLWAMAYDVHAAFRLVYAQVVGAERGAVFIDSHGKATRVETRDAKKGGWVKGPNVKLDSPVEDYCRVAADWLRERNAGPRITQHDQASEPLNYPDYMPPPQVDIEAHQRGRAQRKAEKVKQDEKSAKSEAEWYAKLAKYQAEQADIEPGRDNGRAVVPSLSTSQQPLQLITDPVLLEDIRPEGSAIPTQDDEWWKEVERDRYATSGRHFLRVNAIEAGSSVLNWDRPTTAKLDRTRRLLANGKYEDESASTKATKTTKTTKTTKRKRKDSEEEEQSRVDGENTSGSADEGVDASAGNIGKASKTTHITQRVTRSAIKQARAAAPPAPKPTRKAAALKVRGGASSTTAIAKTTRQRGGLKGK